jgi:hypothetical protein
MNWLNPATFCAVSSSNECAEAHRHWVESGHLPSYRPVMPPLGAPGQLTLRSIGWSQWDPIGLNGSEGGWRFSDAANEYDRYMHRVLEGLEAGESEDSLIEYLVGIEVDHMGLSLTADTRFRAEATVAAIRDCLTR